MFTKKNFDFCVLDVMMPVKDGFTLAEEIRKLDRRIPILFLTAKSLQEDKLRGFEIGADDYLTKPFSMRELVARIAAVLRRAKGSGDDAAVYEDATLRVDGNTFRVHVEGHEVKLAKKEFELLWLLIRNRPAVVSRDRILSEVWQMADDVETRTVDAHIRNLRKKIGKSRITTVIGTGYRFESEGAGAAGA